MKRRSFFFSACLFLAGLSMTFAAEPIEILSINVRLSTANDGDDAWPKRRDSMMEVVRSRNYDFIGGQEVVIHPDDERNQFKFMSEKLPEYGVLYRSREKSEQKGEGTPVFYRKDRWMPDADEQGFFWLSDTPETPGSVTWKGQSTCPRIVTWALFHRRNAEGKTVGDSIYIYCTHFDHVGETARQKASELILRRIAERKTAAPAVMMGDLNTGEASPSIRYLKGEKVELDGETRTPPLALIDTFRAAHPDASEVVTFNGFKTESKPSGNKIDYIFVTPELGTTDAEIIRTKNAEGRWPTDHFPIRAKVDPRSTAR